MHIFMYLPRIRGHRWDSGQIPAHSGSRSSRIALAYCPHTYCQRFEDVIFATMIEAQHTPRFWTVLCNYIVWWRWKLKRRKYLACMNNVNLYEMCGQPWSARVVKRAWSGAEVQRVLDPSATSDGRGSRAGGDGRSLSSIYLEPRVRRHISCDGTTCCK